MMHGIRLEEGLMGREENQRDDYVEWDRDDPIYQEDI